MLRAVNSFVLTLLTLLTLKFLTYCQGGVLSVQDSHSAENVAGCSLRRQLRAVGRASFSGSGGQKTGHQRARADACGNARRE